MENWLLFWGIWGEAELILGICRASQNTFRELKTFFRDLGRSMHYFKRAREHRPPFRGSSLQSCTNSKSTLMMHTCVKGGISEKSFDLEILKVRPGEIK